MGQITKKLGRFADNLDEKLGNAGDWICDKARPLTNAVGNAWDGAKGVHNGYSKFIATHENIHLVGMFVSTALAIYLTYKGMNCIFETFPNQATIENGGLSIADKVASGLLGTGAGILNFFGNLFRYPNDYDARRYRAEHAREKAAEKEA